MPDRWILRAAARRSDFRRLVGTRLAAQFADGVFQASLAGAVLFNPERRGDPADVAAGFAVLLLPYSLLGPFTGVWLDRWSRRRLLVRANLLRVALVLLVAAQTAAGLGGAAFFGSALAVISVGRFVLAALGAAMPHVTDVRYLVTANAAATTAGGVATAAGAAVALGLLSAAGAGDGGHALLAASSGIGYAAAAAVAAGFATTQLGPDAEERGQRESAAAVARELVLGLRHVARRPRAALALSAMGAHRLWYGMTFVVMLLLYRADVTGGGGFGSGAVGLGQAILATATGGLLAAVATPPAAQRWGSWHWATALLAAAAVVEVAVATRFTAPALVATALALGFVGQGVKVTVDATVQREVADRFRGRVFTLYDTIFNAIFVAGASIAAVAVPASGRSAPLLLAAGAGYGVTALLYLLGSRAVDPAAPAVSPRQAPRRAPRQAPRQGGRPRRRR